MVTPFSPSKTALLRLGLPAVFALLVVVVYTDPLFARRSFVGRDLIPYGYPLESATHAAWSQGRLPLWNDDVSGGRPQLPNPNAGAFYPLRPLLALVPFPMAMRILPVAHWIVAGIGMLLLVGALGGSREAGWVAAGTYAFSGVLVSEVFYLPNQAGSALQPWALWSLVRPATSTSRRVLGIAVVYGLMFLEGDAVSLLLALLAASIWILSSASGRRAAAFSLIGGLILAALLAMPQLAATALLVPETRRAVSGVSFAETLTFSLPPWRLLELVVPYFFGESWTLDSARSWATVLFRCRYATLFCGALAVVAIVLGRGSRARRFCVALAVVCAIAAAAGTFAPDSVQKLPSPLPLRYPEKLTVGLTLALALQVGLAYDRIAAHPRRGARLCLGVAAALAALAAASAWNPGLAQGVSRAVGAPAPARYLAATEMPEALAEASLVWLATFGALLVTGAGAAGRQAAALVLSVLPLVVTRRIVRTDRDDAVFPPTAFAGALQRRDPTGQFRGVDASLYRAPSAMVEAAARADPDQTATLRRSWSFHTPSLWRRGTVFNMDLDGGDLSRIESLRRVSSYAATDPAAGPFFGSLGLRYAVRYRDQAPLPGFSRFGGDAVQDWDEAPNAEPDIRIASRWREARDAVSALRLLPQLSAGEIILETGGSAAGGAAAGRVGILERRPERLTISTSTPAPAWLFVARAFWSYRDVRVDGRPVEPVPAQIAFTAVPIPAGQHQVSWREELPGSGYSWVGPVLFALAAGALLRRNRDAGARA